MYKENNGFMACPFCGRSDKVVVLEKSSFYELQGENDTAAMSVRCTRCDAEMWEHTRSVKNYEKRVNIARKKWNKRAAVSPWIPVTVRYPEEKQFFRTDGTEDYDPSPRVLAQLSNGYMKVSRYWSHSQINNTHPWLDLDEWDSDHVVAWMPLPEAYKEGGDSSDRKR